MSQIRCVACAGGFGEVLHLACDHRKTAAGSAGARGLDGRVQRQQIGLLRDRLDRAGDLCDLGQRGADGAEARFDAVDGLDQFGDVADRGVDRVARLGDLADRGRGGRLHRLRGVGDVVVGRDHGLGGLLQMTEPVRLAGDAVRDLLDVAGDVGELDAETADAVGELVDQPFGQRPVRPVSMTASCARDMTGFLQSEPLSAHRGIPIPIPIT